ncbi:unnamed protein product [Gongylonema pulchrum]|uniref:ANK_REP_REGION domain-containing protein n=1 Tax=Gongylonema pulchrum TaxID=637853 RepID=A0A183DW25_9BILA|nr:unnamed protein product [Gongylonema pulchrum]
MIDRYEELILVFDNLSTANNAIDNSFIAVLTEHSPDEDGFLEFTAKIKTKSELICHNSNDSKKNIKDELTARRQEIAELVEKKYAADKKLNNIRQQHSKLIEIENVKKFVRKMMVGYNNKVKKVWESLKGWFKQYYEDEELLDEASNFLLQFIHVISAFSRLYNILTGRMEVVVFNVGVEEHHLQEIKQQKQEQQQRHRQRQQQSNQCLCVYNGRTHDFCYRLPWNKSVHGLPFSCGNAQYLEKLNLLGEARTSGLRYFVNTSVDGLPEVVMVTAFSDNHFNEAIEMVRSFPIKDSYGVSPLFADVFVGKATSERQFIRKVTHKGESLLIKAVACALERECMGLGSGGKNFEVQCSFASDDHYRKYAHCHRFDQSVFNLLMANQYGFETNRYFKDGKNLFEIYRGTSRIITAGMLSCEAHDKI